MTPLDHFVRDLRNSLDLAAFREFGPVEELMLRRSLTACGMEQYPPPLEEHDFDRSSGDMVCEKCGRQYAAHPMDWRLIGYGNVPFLNILCDGRRVKL